VSVLSALLLGVAVAEAAVRGGAAAVAARDLFRRMAAEGRDPTPEEWAALTAVSDALHDRIQQG
jgi:hypothetical protein